MRVALYFAPPRESELSLAAAGWLGRDPWAGQASDVDARRLEPAVEHHADLVREPGRYGFHATLKPPFRLADAISLEELRAAMAEFGSSSKSVVLPALSLERIGAFFALTSAEDVPELRRLADDVVRRFERFRAPLSESEGARRRPERLTERQRNYLAVWGYPYVFEEFRFHMTLTGPVPESRQDEIATLLTARFAPFIGRPLSVDRLCLFIEPSPPGDFTVDSFAILR